MFNPLRLFARVGILIASIGFLISIRFVYYFFIGAGEGKIQSLILAAILMIIGFQILVAGLVADLISANRRLLEDTLLRVKKIELKQKREKD